MKLRKYLNVIITRNRKIVVNEIQLMADVIWRIPCTACCDYGDEKIGRWFGFDRWKHIYFE